jgi:hypothetical protein
VGEAEVDRAEGGEPARLGDRRQALEDPVLGVLGDPGHGAGAAEAGLPALGAAGHAGRGTPLAGLGDVERAVGAEGDPAWVVEPVRDHLQDTATATGTAGTAARTAGRAAQGGHRGQREQAGDDAGPP